MKRLTPNTLVLISIADIIKAGYNPPNREKNAPRSALANSIGKIGMLAPLIITPSYNLIDGHRRLSVAIDRGEDKIECVVREVNQADAYSAINTTSVRMTGNDMLHLYFNDGALTDIQKGSVSKAEEVLGRTLLKSIQKNGYSLNVFNLAMQTARKIGVDDNPKFVKKTVEWIMEFGVPTLRKAVEGNTSARLIRETIESFEQLESQVVRGRTPKKPAEMIEV